MTEKDKKLPGPCSQRQLMYIESQADVTLYGGELRLHLKTLLNGETLTSNVEGNPVPMFKDSA